MTVNTQHIEQLLRDKKYDEVRALLNAAVAEKMTNVERGAALVGLASVYLDVSNAIQGQYRDALKEAIAGMANINKAQNKIVDTAALAATRDSLGI